LGNVWIFVQLNQRPMRTKNQLYKNPKIVQLRIPYTSAAAALDLGLGEFARQPVQSLVETVTLGRARRLDVPLPVPEVLQPELVCELTSAHGIGQVLLVGEDEEMRVSQLVLLQHLLQLVLRLSDPLAVVGVDDEDESLGVLEVVAPQRADLVLTADVPHGEADVLVLDRLHVEADGGNRRDDLSELQLVQDGSLSGGVESHHENSHLLLAKEPRKHAGYRQTHGCVEGEQQRGKLIMKN